MAAGALPLSESRRAKLKIQRNEKVEEIEDIMIKRKQLALMTAAILVTSLSGATSYAAQKLPSADSTIRQVQENQVGREQAKRNITNEVDEQNAQKLVGTQKIYVKGYQFVGQHPFSQEELGAVLQADQDKEITIEQLNDITQKISAYANKKGYAAVAVQLPPQEIMDNVVQISVNVGKVGEVRLVNDSGLEDERLLKYANELQKQEYITTAALEKILVRLDQLKGTENNLQMVAGKAQGTTDIVLKVAIPKQQNFMLFADNSGSKYAGKYRYGATGSIFNLDKVGSNLDITGLYSNEGLYNAALTYETPLGVKGSKLGVSYSRLDYTLGDYFSLLGAQGIADTYSLYVTTPLVESLKHQVTLNYGYDYKKLKDEFEAFDLETKKTANVFHVGVTGQDSSARSITNYALMYYGGHYNIESTVSPYSNEGTFHKGTLDVNYLTNLAPNLNLLAMLHGQVASRDLDSAEQMSLGGPSGVRAYAQGEGSGDTGLQTTVELQYQTPVPNLTLAGFFDLGSVKLAKSMSGSRNLKGAGIGLQYSKTDDLYVRLDYAWKINGEYDISEGTNDQGRLWFKVYKTL